MILSQAAARICFVINNYDLRTDTHYRHLYRLFEVVARQREAVLLVENPPPPDNSASPLDDVVFVQPYRTMLARVLNEMRLLVILRRKGFNRFYVHYSKYGGILAAFTCRVTGGKTYYWHCEEIMKYRSLSNWRWREMPTWLAMKLAHDVMTGNEALARHYSVAFNIPLSKIKILPNSIDLAEFEFDSVARAEAKASLGLETRRVILFVHRLNERKGPQHLPGIAQRLVERGVTGFTILVVGDGPYRPTLEAQIEQMQLGDYFYLAGAVPNAEVGHYFAAADLFVMPSEVEGFPRVLLEAMASGLPIIATDVGGVTQLLRDKQLDFVLQPGQVESFGRSIAGLLNDSHLRQELVQIGYDVVKNYSLEKAAERFLILLEES